MRGCRILSCRTIRSVLYMMHASVDHKYQFMVKASMIAIRKRQKFGFRYRYSVKFEDEYKQVSPGVKRNNENKLRRTKLENHLMKQYFCFIVELTITAS